MSGDSDHTTELKDKGNSQFKNGEYRTAAETYSEALKALSSSNELSSERAAVLLKNRSACYLKLKNYEECIVDATKSLEISPGDSKSLFRRCQAHDAKGDVASALADAKSFLKLEPTNKAANELMRSINAKLHQKAGKLQTTGGMIDEMVNVFTDEANSGEKRGTALKNLTIYAHQPGGADLIVEKNYIHKLKAKCLDSKEDDFIVKFVKILHGLCIKNFNRSMVMSRIVTTNELFTLCAKNAKNIELVQAVLSVQIEIVMTMVAHFKTVHVLSSEDQEKWKKCVENAKSIQTDLEGLNLYDEIMKTFIASLQSASLPMEACLSLVDALIKLIDAHKAISDSIRKANGVKVLIEIGSCPSYYTDTKDNPDLLAEDSMPEKVRMHMAIALSKIYKHLYAEEAERTKFKEICLGFVSQLFLHSKIEKRLQGLSAYSTLFQAMQDTGDSVVQVDIIDKIVDMCKSSNVFVQILSIEVLAHASGDKEASKMIRSSGTDVLQKLYQSQNKKIKLRCLVCLCKLGATTSGNINDSVFDEDVSVKLYKSVRSFMLDQNEATDMTTKWCIEALAYLTINAIVKDLLVKDTEFITKVMNLSKSEDQSLLYGVCSCLVNITNSYDKPTPDPEMEKLAEFAKQPMPKLHEKDQETFVKQRIDDLKKKGLINCLIELSKTDSSNSKEMVSRVFHAVICDPESRGSVVQQGGYKALIPLSLNGGTEVGKDLAAQSIAKIGITTNPSLAFPGQRCMEVVRPLIKLLSVTKTGLQQFEALMALTNLAQIGDDVRKRIIEEKGLISIEVLMFDENDLIKRAATECMCNMILSDEVFEMYKENDSQNERLKLMLLYCGEEPFELSRAAAGAIAMLTSDQEICKLIIQIKPWLDILKYLVVSDNADLQYRGIYIVGNMLRVSKTIAEQLISSELFEVLVAISQLSASTQQKTIDAAKRALEAAVEWNLIQRNSADAAD